VAASGNVDTAPRKNVPGPQRDAFRMKKNLPVTGKDVAYPVSRVLVSSTDLKGQITFANEDDGTRKAVESMHQSRATAQERAFVRGFDEIS
jgi:hypothetical protein